jgi:hypothetical protein
MLSHLFHPLITLWSLAVELVAVTSTVPAVELVDLELVHHSRLAQVLQ